MKNRTVYQWIAAAALTACLQSQAGAQSTTLNAVDLAIWGTEPDLQKKAAFDQALKSVDAEAAIQAVESRLPSLNSKAWQMLMNKMGSLQNCKSEPLNWDNKSPVSKCERGITLLSNHIHQAIEKDIKNPEMQDIGVASLLWAGAFNPNPYAFELEMERVKQRFPSLPAQNHKQFAQALGGTLGWVYGLSGSKIEPVNNTQNHTREMIIENRYRYNKIINKTSMDFLDISSVALVNEGDFMSFAELSYPYSRTEQRSSADWFHSMELRAKNKSKLSVPANIILAVVNFQNKNIKAAKLNAAYFKDSKNPQLASLAKEILGSD